jgi:hypothetical protein
MNGHVLLSNESYRTNVTKLGLLVRMGMLPKSHPRFSLDKDIDLALIPVTLERGLFQGLNVSRRQVSLGVTLYGLGTREAGFVHLTCQVQDRDGHGMPRWQTSCGHAPDFSRTGFVTENAVLVGFYRGRGEFVHLDNHLESKFKEHETKLSDAGVSPAVHPWKEVETNCTNTAGAWSNALKEWIDLVVRTPRSRLESASDLWSLAT